MILEGRQIHESTGAGRWFPAETKSLRDLVEDAIANAVVPEIPTRIIAGVAPHAGYVYSGKTAGHTYRALQHNVEAGYPIDTVIVLGFSHSQAFDGVAIMDGAAVRTPLGDVKIDRETGYALAKAHKHIRILNDPHNGEHSVENQIPFIQVALPEVAVLPVLIGDHSSVTLDALADACQCVSEMKRIVVMASTDLFHNHDYHTVSAMDRDTVKAAAALDIEWMRSGWRPDHQLCCGIGPLLTVMQIARERQAEGCCLQYCNSGDEFPQCRGDWVVGYGALVYYLSQ